MSEDSSVVSKFRSMIEGSALTKNGNGPQQLECQLKTPMPQEGIGASIKIMV